MLVVAALAVAAVAAVAIVVLAGAVLCRRGGAFRQARLEAVGLAFIVDLRRIIGRCRGCAVADVVVVLARVG